MKKYVIYNLKTKKYLDTINDVSCMSHPGISDTLSEYKSINSVELYDSEEDAHNYLESNKSKLFLGAWDDDVFFDIRPVYFFKNPLEY